MLTAQPLQGKRFVVVCRIESINHRARVSKVVDVLLAYGAEVTLWKLQSPNIACRVPEVAIARAREKRVGKYLSYVLWIVRLFIRARQATRADCYWCVGLDSAAPIAAANRRLRRNMVFDHADNLSKSYRLTFFAKALLEVLERWIARDARIHLVPSASRWPSPDPNRRIVPNVPTRSAFEEAVRIATSREYCRPHLLTLYINGWLTGTRGIQTLSRALELLHRRDVPIRLLVAGGVRSAEADALVRDYRTEYVGVVSNAEALALYFRASLAFTYYDPRIEINRIAEPNKWGDCLVTHTPFICNEEILTVRDYLLNRCCLAAPYDDHLRLARTLEELVGAPSLVFDLARGFQRMPPRFWDDKIFEVAKECVEA